MTGIKDIVAEEWRQFQLVQNEGGRASCQDDFPEFRRQRESQFRAWPQQLLDSYYQDLLDAAQQGRNLLTEKYAYMMRETAPERFAAMEHLLPPVDGEKRALVEEIVAAHLEWAERFAERFPLYAATGRPLRAADAFPGQTAIETYTRGELTTYSTRTLRLYADYVRRCREQGVNLAQEIRDNTARSIGLSGSEEAEEMLARKYGKA